MCPGDVSAVWKPAEKRMLKHVGGSARSVREPGEVLGANRSTASFAVWENIICCDYIAVMVSSPGFL
ncbi:MAG: hypothetical protein KJN62_09145 [Deltaproteobacteria bacterium]|nr:hypothetical protein [Deltaproteobacteria bacterium]